MGDPFRGKFSARILIGSDLGSLYRKNHENFMLDQEKEKLKRLEKELEQSKKREDEVEREVEDIIKQSGFVAIDILVGGRDGAMGRRCTARLLAVLRRYKVKIITGALAFALLCLILNAAFVFLLVRVFT